MTFKERYDKSRRVFHLLRSDLEGPLPEPEAGSEETWLRDNPMDRGALARLRRLGQGDGEVGRLDVIPILEIPQVVLALRAVGVSNDRAAEGPLATWQIECACAAMAAVANIKVMSSVDTPKALAANKGNGAIMKAPRFARLMQVETPLDRLLAGKRIVQLLDGRADPGRLGADLYHWNANIRRRWAFAYHGAQLPDDILFNTPTNEIAA